MASFPDIMKSLRLIFGTYNHQPEGNLPELFERAYGYIRQYY